MLFLLLSIAVCATAPYVFAQEMSVMHSMPPPGCPPCNCTFPLSMVSATVGPATVCCPSCNPYSASCPSACTTGKKMARDSCFTTCGNRGCRRGMCGEPEEFGKRCCPKVNCPNRNRIYLDEKCCPHCAPTAIDIASNVSSIQCLFNSTDGVGEIRLDPVTQEVALMRMKPRIVSIGAGLSDVGKICSGGGFRLINDTSRNLDKNLQRYMTLLFTNLSMAVNGNSFSLMGSIKMGADQLFSQIEADLGSLKTKVNAETQLNCKNPLQCYVKGIERVIAMFRNVSADLTFIVDTATSGSMTLSQKGIAIVSRFGMIASRQMTSNKQNGDSLKCFEMAALKSPCVEFIKSLNMFEIMDRTRNCRACQDKDTISRITSSFMHFVNRDTVPGVDILQNLTCAEIRTDPSSQCRIEMYRKIGEHISRHCGLGRLTEDMATFLDHKLKSCTNNGASATVSDVDNFLGPCTFTDSLVRGFNGNILLEALNTSYSAAEPNTLQRMQASCPEKLRLVGERISETVDPRSIDGESFKNLISVLTPSALKKVPPTICNEIKSNPENLRTISDSLSMDPEVDAKCGIIMGMCKSGFDNNQKRNFTACGRQLAGKDIGSVYNSVSDMGSYFKKSEMKRPDVFTSAQSGVRQVALRELGSGRINVGNFDTYADTLWAVPDEKIDSAVCSDATSYAKLLTQLGPRDSKVKKCLETRTKPSSPSDLSGLSKDSLLTFSSRDIKSALGGAGTNLTDSITTIMSTLFPTTTTTTTLTGSIPKLNAYKDNKKRDQLAKSLVQPYFDSVDPTGLTADDISPTVFIKATARFLAKMDNSMMLTVAKQCSSQISEVNRGTGRKAVDGICSETSSCRNLDADAVNNIGNFVIFLTSAQIDNILSSVLPTYCQIIAKLDQATMQDKMPLAEQRKCKEKCLSHIDLSSTGSGSDVDMSGPSASFDVTTLSSFSACALTASEISRINSTALDTCMENMQTCPPDDSRDNAVASRYCATVGAGNYSLAKLRRFAGNLATASGCDLTKLSRDEVQANGGEVEDSFSALELANKKREDEGNSNDNTDPTSRRQRAHRALIERITGGSGARRKRAAATMTCTDIQNLQGGVASLTAAELDGISSSEFDSCFSVFGNADTAWTTDHCTKLKAKTEVLYGATTGWNDTILLTVTCMTQCWDQSSINSIPYTGISHISNIGTYCSKLPTATRGHIMTRYIAAVHSSSATTLTLSEIGSMGHLTCGPSTTHIGQMSHSHVVNSLSDLGSAGPCAASVMESYIARVKANLGATVSSWSASYLATLNHLLGGLSSSDIQSLSADQIAQIPTAAITNLSGSKLASFTVTQLGYFSDSQKSAVTSSQLSSLSDSQRSALGQSSTTTATPAGADLASFSKLVLCLLISLTILAKTL